jgi:hypothetical protein
MFANVTKLGLTALSTLIITVGAPIARADDSAAERAFR